MGQIKNDLKEFFYINKSKIKLEEEIFNLTKDMATSKKPYKQKLAINRRRIQLKEIITSDQYMDLNKKVNTFIELIDDRYIKKIFTDRYIKCMTWDEVGEEYFRYTKDAVRKIVVRYIQKMEELECQK